METLIVDSIIKYLYKVFPEIPAYDDLIRWDNTGEAFFISVVETQRSPNLGALNKDTVLLDILYDPGIHQPDTKCRSMDGALKDLMEYIPRIDKPRKYFQSNNIRTTTVNGLLHITFSITTYKTKVWEERPVKRIDLKIEEKFNA